MASGTIRIDVDGHVATLTISRPEKLNALDLDMLKALADAADEVEANANVRAAILTGEGKGFSAGGDIKAWGGMLPQEFGHLWVRHGHRIFERLATLRMPLVAALNGHALGEALNLQGLRTFASPRNRSRSACPRPALAWYRVGPGPSVLCAGSGRRPSDAWPWAARYSLPRRHACSGS